MPALNLSVGNRGHVELILGPMFAGKSTELLRRVRRYSNANRECLVIKYKKDTRYGRQELFSTHDKQTLEALPAEILMDQYEEAMRFDVVGVDEGQFFPDIVEFCEKLAGVGKIVVISALDGTFQRKPFGNVLQLIPMAEEVHKLTAVCKGCFRDAAFTRRLGTETQVEVIGGAEMYVPVCRECYDRPNFEMGSP